LLTADTPRRTLDFDQRVAWLRLIRTGNVGPVSFRQLLNRFGSADAALDALPGLTRKGGAAGVRIPSREEAEHEIERLEGVGGHFVALDEPDYPDLLRFVHGPPPLLSMIGRAPGGWGRAISIVGARNASAAGRRLTGDIARELGQAGLLVVSGLARGIDTAAHHASLETGTVAVFAGGIDYIYPWENRDLAHAIVEHGGALLTEMPFGAEPRARDFPRRNRLVSGISLGTLVVEAAKRSGSLITARLALEQDREVFAVPGSPLDPRSEGTNQLIRQGATLVAGASDIISELETVRSPAQGALEPGFDFAGAEQGGAHAEPDDSERERVVAALSVTPTPIDDLIAATGLPAAALQTVLLELELAGRIERSAGQLVALS